MIGSSLLIQMRSLLKCCTAGKRLIDSHRVDRYVPWSLQHDRDPEGRVRERTLEERCFRRRGGERDGETDRDSRSWPLLTLLVLPVVGL